MNRREFLALAGVTGASGSLAGCLFDGDRGDDGQSPTPPTEVGSATPDTNPSTPTPIKVPYADEFRTVLNVVEQGATPDGSESITPLLQSLVDDNVLLSFPPGEYRFEPLKLEGLSNVGFAAAGDERPLLLPVEQCDRSPFLRFEEVDSLLIDGFDVDFRPAGAGGPVQIYSTGDFTVRNLRMRGSCDPQIAMMRFDVRDPEGVGLVENLVLQNPLDRHARLTGAYVGEDHAGEITFRDCAISGFTDNGLYGSSPGNASGQNGVVHVEGGRYTNNNVANVRLGSTGSTARNVEVVVDTEPPHPLAVNARGIRLRDRSGQLIEDCRVRFGSDAGFSFGGVVLHPANGSAEIRNTHITIDAPRTPAVRALPPEASNDTGLTLDGLTIDGESPDGTAILLENRSGSRVRNCRITQPGSDRGALHLIQTRNCRLVDSYVEVSGPPVKLDDARLRIENTTFNRPGEGTPGPVTVGSDGPVVWDSDDPDVGDATSLPDWDGGSE